MIVHIFFSLLGSPSDAFGRVSGGFEIDLPIEKGREVHVLRPKESDWFGGSLKIETVTRFPNQERLFVGLQDIVVKSKDDASRLGGRFEAEAGLLWDAYD
ncbi:hypothetical protein [Ramlibacter humi]|uniref:Uncharacterized protein n=1 Tax=Ramlibacter humi TaxID=2530451 RepID=A0A4Z0BAS6_9BURK|nr:hypothetical protein [Ramlibacter humi]TFY96152.1 hypothetical protein EZ216_21155 [Ramlibacter humi]